MVEEKNMNKEISPGKRFAGEIHRRVKEGAGRVGQKVGEAAKKVDEFLV